MLDDVGLKVNVGDADQPTFLRRRQGTPADAGKLASGSLVLRLPGRRRRDLPVVPHRQHLGEITNPAFDAEVDAARSILDPDKAQLGLLRRAFEILREDVPGLGLYQDYRDLCSRARS